MSESSEEGLSAGGPEERLDPASGGPGGAASPGVTPEQPGKWADTEGDKAPRDEATRSSKRAEDAVRPGRQENSHSTRYSPSRPGGSDDGDRPEQFAEREYAKSQGERILLRRNAVTYGDRSNAYYIEHQTVFIGEREIRIEKSRFGEARIGTEIGTYVPVANFQEIDTALSHQRLVLIHGLAGSGRRATATALLANQCSLDQIGGLDVDDGNVLSILTQHPELIDPGDGFVIDLAGRPARLATLEALRSLAEDTKSFIVVVDVGTTSSADLHPYSYKHSKPDLQKVLRSHVEWLVASHLFDCKEENCSNESVTTSTQTRLRSDVVTRQLALVSSVRQVVELAHVMISRVHSDDDLSQLIATWQNQLRNLAGEMLRGDSEEDTRKPEHTGKPELVQHRQAFRIAYAVFHAHPLSDVFESSDLLYREILPRFEVHDAVRTHRVFDSNIGDLTYPGLIAQPDAAGGGPAQDNPRRAWVADEELVSAILEAAWHDYESLRRPLEAWLTVLAASDLVRVQVRAAQVVGLLARFDFDDVYRSLIRVWARGKANYRQAAALAMEVAYLEPAIAPRVGDRLRGWAGSPNPLLQDSAARTYGTQIGEHDVPKALKVLSDLGSRPELARSSSVAGAIASLFLADEQDSVLATLPQWIKAHNDYLPYHAVNTLLLLARLMTNGKRNGWPILSELAFDSDQRQEALVDLWQRALLGLGTSFRAWEPMRRWLVSSDNDEQLATLTESLARRIFAAQPLKRRARFYLSIWRHRPPESKIIASLHDHLAYSTPHSNDNGD